ncbi:amidohydrolase family protein [Salipiger sp. P9]|uniref:dihydroorotase n=1 Tax=Salipiger pentaromativorans TaxID=2943193 RepID=UPI0021572FBA|nr:amidohydrolase family protein [Salipiger pentaromativorans]MCR8547507.1 amidohydrolase family protein [Salipiger pentaromativorans]
MILRNGIVVDPLDGARPADLAISNGVIAAILQPGSEAASRRQIDVSGKYLFPGIIEPHTHIGFLNDFDADVTSESASAAIGGVTTVFSFHRHYKSAEPKPYDDLPELIGAIDAGAHVDMALHLGMLTEDQTGEIEKYIDQGVSSFKFYMAYRGEDGKTVGMINDIDDGVMFDAFTTLGRFDHAVACVHCENTEIIGRRVRAAKAAGRADLAAWNAARPSFAEAEHVRRAGYFAEEAGCNLYYVHIGAQKSVDEAILQKARYDRITIETCPHYLTLTETSALGPMAKVNPPVRAQADQDRIWETVLSGEIETIGTDHCAMPRTRKAGDIWQASPGFPGMATMLPVMLHHGHHKRGMGLQEIAKALSYNAAKAFNLLPRKGALQVGFDADIAVVDLEMEQTVTPEALGSSADFSLQEGEVLKGWPVMTLLRGKLVAEGGRVVGSAGDGAYLAR